MSALTATQFAAFYVGQIIAFSLCFIVVERITRPVVIWLISNVVSALGFVMAPLQLVPNEEVGIIIGGVLALFGGTLKAMAFSDRLVMRRSNYTAHALLIGGFVTAVLLVFSLDLPYRLMLVALSGIMTSLAALLYLKANRAWLGLRPAKLTQVVLWLSIIAFVSRIPEAYPIGSQTRFVGEGSDQSLNLFMVCAFSFLLQISFLGLIVSRQLRDQLLSARRASRIHVHAIAMREKQRESAALADERFHLLKMLTHEVRQPLNTAQAALQSVIDEVGRNDATSKETHPAIDRALVTLNSIALSISNSILGATLIAKGRVAQFQMIDLCAVSQLSLLDINPSDRKRIVYDFAQDVIFAEADPIVLRLAIRNLLENALKYSPAGTAVHFEIRIDEEEMSAIFRVINEVTDPASLKGDIFERDKRGVDSRYEGFGLGLYIVREVAAIHRGHLQYNIIDSGGVAFELHIPC